MTKLVSHFGESVPVTQPIRSKCAALKDERMSDGKKFAVSEKYLVLQERSLPDCQRGWTRILFRRRNCRSIWNVKRWLTAQTYIPGNVL
jgi:hypothetical protein